MKQAKKNGNDSKLRSTPDELPMDDLVRALWMGLGGRTQDLATYLHRIVPKWRSWNPDLAQRVEALLGQNQRHSSVSRSVRFDEGTSFAKPSFAHFGGEDLGDLIRIESNIELSVDPVWPPQVQTALMALIEERRSLKRLHSVGLMPTRTVIFTGPPGVGKTLAARWIAQQLDLPLCTLNLSAVMSSFLGRTGSNLTQVMTVALNSPCILFFDEIDAIAKRRDDNTDIGELKRLVTVLLQALDSWPSTNLLIAATNHDQLLDPAVWRRFESRVEFSMLGAELQSQLLAKLLGKDWGILDRREQYEIAIASEIFSPCDLTQIAYRAKRESVLSGADFRERLLGNLHGAIHALPLAMRRAAGEQLKKRGYGQREIHRITGLARETIREM